MGDDKGEKAEKAKKAPAAKNVDEQCEQLVGGPVEPRHCTDIICCLIFIAYMIFMVVLAVDGVANGEPKRLVSVFDSSWFPCGRKTTSGVPSSISSNNEVNLENYPYIYFPIPHPDHLNKTVCVKTCPTYASDEDPDVVYKDGIPCNLYNQTDGQFLEQAGNDMTCKASCSPFSTLSSGASSTQGWSVTPGINWQNLFCFYKTTTLMGRICFPGTEVFGFVEGLATGLSSSINMDQLTSWMNDVDKGSDIVYASFGIVFLLGLVYMIFVRIFSGVIVWIIILLFFLLLGLMGIFLYQKYIDIKDAIAANGGDDQEPNTQKNQDTYMYLSYTVGILWICCLIGLFCMWNNIKLAIAIIKTATLFMMNVPTSMLIPPIMALVCIVWWIIWFIFFVHVFAVGDVTKKSASSIFATVIWGDQQVYFVWAFIFGGLWVNAFFQALTQFLLASTVSIWYWSQPEGNAHAPVVRSIYRAFRYHLGTLAFGSFILAIVQTLQLMLEYFYQQSKAAGAEENKVMKYVLKCLRCCLLCFERFIKFLNKNAYIQCALAGENFCTSAKQGMQMVWDNATRVALVSGLGAAFVFVGKVFMICCTVFICYTIYTDYEPYKTEMSSTFLPCLIIFCISWGVATIFLSVYGMAIDTILMCYLYDEKMHKGDTSGKMRAPDTLKSFFAKHDKKAEEAAKKKEAEEAAKK